MPLHQPRQERAHHVDARIFVEFGESHGFRPPSSGPPVNFGHDLAAAKVAACRSVVNLVESSARFKPVFAQNPSLPLTALGQFVVVRFEERSLPVPDQSKQSHAEANRITYVGEKKL